MHFWSVIYASCAHIVQNDNVKMYTNTYKKTPELASKKK